MRIHREQFREYTDESKYKNYVNSEKSDLNFYKELSENGADWNLRVKQAVELSQRTTKRRVRSDAIVICSTIESVPSSWDLNVCKKYFQDKAEWLRQFLHENAGIPSDAMLSLVCHFDESNPHATISWIPIKDGKLQAKNICTKVLYKQLQAKSQDFTFKWIDNYNKTHEEQLEKLEPYKEGGIRKHLSEQEYKEKKIADHIQQLEAKHDELREEVSDTLRQHQEVSEQLSNAKAELEKTHADTAEVLAAGMVAEQKIQESKLYEQNLNRREQRLSDLTNSPSLASYQEVKEENQDLKQQISLKDKIIESLQEQNLKLQQTLNTWKEKIQHLGKRMATALGFQENEYAGGTQHVSEFPDSAVKEAYESAVSIVQDIDPRFLRVIPDQQSGKYVLASKDNNGKYQIQEGGFATRELADRRRRELTKAKVDLDRTYDQSLEKRLTK